MKEMLVLFVFVTLVLVISPMVYVSLKWGKGEFAGARLVVVASTWNLFLRCALFCYIAHFVSSRLIRLIMTALAELGLELGSEQSKIGGRANMPMSILDILPSIADDSRVVLMWDRGQYR